VVIKSLFEWYVSDEPLLENLRKPQKSLKTAAHRAQRNFTLSPLRSLRRNSSALYRLPLAAFFALKLRENPLRFFGSWKSLIDHQRSLEIGAR
jgi:hypothetical protein